MQALLRSAFGRLRRAALAVAILSALSCQSTQRLPPNPYGPFPVVEQRGWEVWRNQDQIGRLVLIELRGRQPPLSYYRVETRTGQWAGYVGRNGRFFKLVPFRPVELGPEDLGYYPMEEGLALLFEVQGPIRIVAEKPAATEPATTTAMNERR